LLPRVGKCGALLSPLHYFCTKNLNCFSESILHAANVGELFLADFRPGD
jgi:hypothetical protein